MSEEPPLVLIVEDEPDLADLYAAWLGDDYRVRTAYGGREALDLLDDEISVALLDRRMPRLSGDSVLEALRDRGIDCRVAMVTAVEPDFDIVAMGFDDYLVKPVTRGSLRETVEQLVRRGSYDRGVQELFALATKRAVLEEQKAAGELDANEEYGRLEDRYQELSDELSRTLPDVADHDEFVGFYRDLDRDAVPDER